MAQKRKAGANLAPAGETTNYDSEMLIVVGIGGWAVTNAMHITQFDCGRAVDVIRDADDQPIVSGLCFTGGGDLLVDIFIAPVIKGALFDIGGALGDTVNCQFDCAIGNGCIGITPSRSDSGS